MNKRLMFIPHLTEFTDDSTGEVVKGGRIALADVEARDDNSGIGYYCELLWVNETILNSLKNNPKAKELPQEVEVVLENRGIKQRPRLVDVKYIN